MMTAIEYWQDSLAKFFPTSKGPTNTEIAMYNGAMEQAEAEMAEKDAEIADLKRLLDESSKNTSHIYQDKLRKEIIELSASLEAEMSSNIRAEEKIELLESRINRLRAVLEEINIRLGSLKTTEWKESPPKVIDEMWECLDLTRDVLGDDKEIQ